MLNIIFHTNRLYSLYYFPRILSIHTHTHTHTYTYIFFFSFLPSLIWPAYFKQNITSLGYSYSSLLLLLLSRFSSVRLCNPIDGRPPGSPVPGILQARTLEWAAISFSNVWNWKVKVKSLSRVWLLATPWTAAYQAPPPMGFSREEYWSGLPLPSPYSCLELSKELLCFFFSISFNMRWAFQQTWHMH